MNQDEEHTVCETMPKMALLAVAKRENVPHRDYYTRAELAHNINAERARRGAAQRV